MPRVKQVPPPKIPPPHIVLMARNSRLLSSGSGLLTPPDAHPLHTILSRNQARIRPLFTPEHLKSDVPAFYHVAAPTIPAQQLHDLAAELRDNEFVESAFVKPSAIPANVNTMPPAADTAPPHTPDFTTRQRYLDAAPSGIDARFAWTYPGGSGLNIRIIDIEGSWQFTHEDLASGFNGLTGGEPLDDINWRNHGTAVLGVIISDRNGLGVTGICPDARLRSIAAFGDVMNSSSAIHLAADLLSPGDIILVELHRAGPRFQFQNEDDQRGYIPIEWWPDDQAAIQYATRKGIIVVEAGGNGAEDLDDSLYDSNPGPPFGPFPATWRNPFRAGQLDTGAILVGAGAPPPGILGEDFGPDRSRLPFSNFGSRVDVQGWGRAVTTCGYGDLQGGDSEDLWYTGHFSGTSSASPIIVGVVASMQGALRAANKAQLGPAGARDLLRHSGSPQQPRAGEATLEHIGNRPDLREILLTVVG